MKIMAVILAQVFLYSLSAYAQYYPARAPHSNDHRAEQDFVTLAAERESGEIAHANLALQRAADAQTRQIAQLIGSQDSQALAELRKIANRDHFSVPDQLSAQGQEEQSTLSKLAGVRFDADYTDLTWERLQFDIPRFEAEKKEASVPELSIFAAKAVPVMRKQDALLSQITPNEREKAE
jgi:predicted outer membrane protein